MKSGIIVIVIAAITFVAFSFSQNHNCFVLPNSTENSLPYEVTLNPIIPKTKTTHLDSTGFREGHRLTSEVSFHEEKFNLVGQTSTTRDKIAIDGHTASARSQKPFNNSYRNNPDIIQSALPPQYEVNSLTHSASTIEWEVDEGLPLPLVLTESETDHTAPMQKANELMAQQFEKDIGFSSDAKSEVAVTTQTWLDAKTKSDELFKALYGDAAYNQRLMQAAQSDLRK